MCSVLGKLLIAFLLLTPALSSAQDERASAIAQFKVKNYAQAQRGFELLQAQDPKDAETQYYLGRIALAGKKAEESVEHLRQAVALAPAAAEYYHYLGQALGAYVGEVSAFRKMSVAREIRDAFSRAVELDPNFLDAREGLMAFYMEAPGFAGGSMDRAREQAAEIAKRNPARGHRAFADIHFKNERFDEAIAEYKASMAAAPADMEARYKLGSMYQQLKRYDDAFALYEEILGLNPKAAAAYYGLGRSAVVSGQRLERGEQALKTYLALGPQGEGEPPLSAAHWRLGMVYELQKRTDKARAEYQAALKLDPQYKEAREALDKLK